MNTTLLDVMSLNMTNSDSYHVVTNVQSTANATNDDSDYPYQDIEDVALAINKYYLWLIFAIGFPGNLASIVTIFRMRSLGSFTLYVVLLAVMDNLALLLKLTIYQLLVDKINIATSGCRILIFLATFCNSYANWILVLMAAERLVAVRYPLKIQEYLGYRKSIMWICIVGVVIAGAYAPILWMFYYNTEFTTCLVTPDSADLMKYLHWTNISLSAFIPFLCLAVFNVLIMRVIRQSFRLRNALRNVNSTPLARRSSCYDISIQRQIMLMLFTATLVFVVFLFPLCALNVANVYWDVEPRSLGHAIKYLCSQIAFLLFDSTHALNFYLYFLSARKFRSHFLRMSSCSAPNDRPTSIKLKFRNQFHRMSLLTSTTTRPTPV